MLDPLDLPWIILAIGILIFLWKVWNQPEKTVDVARNFARAVKVFKEEASGETRYRIDLSDSQLIQMAKAMGIEGAERMSREELEQAVIEEARRRGLIPQEGGQQKEGQQQEQRS